MLAPPEAGPPLASYHRRVPELPEVEFARRQLQRWLGGAVIEDVRVHDARVVRMPGADRGALLEAGLRGRTVRKVERRGKWLRFTLDEGLVFSHLGMTGKWVRGDEPARFEKVELVVSKGGKRAHVRYVDPRMFGGLQLRADDLPAWRKLGPDPLHDGLDAGALRERLQRRAGPIKPALLDQQLVAGVGNIQAQEALFLAKLDPRRTARSLSPREVRALVRGLDRSIARTLAAEDGPSIQYVEEPGAANPFLVYGRAGEPCPRCKRKLTRIEQAGRGTVWCRACQR